MNPVVTDHTPQYLRSLLSHAAWPLVEKYINEAVHNLEEEAFSAKAGAEQLHAARGARQVRDTVIAALKRDAAKAEGEA